MNPRVDLHLGDCLDVLRTLPSGSVDAVVTDPPYGMKWRTNSKRFSRPTSRKLGSGRDDYPAIHGDDKPFDPSPWLCFPKVVMWGANHYAARLPVGTTLIWLKKADHLFGTFLSDAEVGWMKGGHGVYCFRKQFPPPCRIQEGGLKKKAVHPTQKPIALMEWCIRRLRLPEEATIFDPYMGSGTTGIAAIRQGMNFIGCELSPEYFAIARRRIDAALDEMPLFARR